MFDERRFRARVEQYREANERTMGEDPVTVVEKIAERFALVESERSSVLKHSMQGADLSAWGLANAITGIGGDVKDYDRANELEALDGKVIELAPSECRHMAEAK